MILIKYGAVHTMYIFENYFSSEEKKEEIRRSPNEKLLYFTTEKFTFLSKNLLYCRKLNYMKSIFFYKT